MAQISADEAVLFRFEQRILIPPEGEASFVHQPLKICAIGEICGFNRGFGERTPLACGFRRPAENLVSHIFPRRKFRE